MTCEAMKSCIISGRLLASSPSNLCFLALQTNDCWRCIFKFCTFASREIVSSNLSGETLILQPTSWILHLFYYMFSWQQHNYTSNYQKRNIHFSPVNSFVFVPQNIHFSKWPMRRSMSWWAKQLHVGPSSPHRLEAVGSIRTRCDISKAFFER